MSGIAGICNLDGRPLERELLQRITRVAAARGPDGVAYWNGGALGLSHLALHTTPEARYEKQPLGDDSGRLRLVFDGRVDNREQLLAELTSRGFPPRPAEGVVTDAELVLQSYRCWGVQCPHRILGDFAFALWDDAEQQLFCARDIIGIRPFYYFLDPQTFVFATELPQVLAHPAVPRRPNEAMVAEYLTTNPVSKTETLWQGLLRLPPAHFLTLRDGVARLNRYWDIDPHHQIRYRSDDEYGEHYLHILKQAVACRLRRTGPLGAHLSGGMDSSSVVAVAQHLLREAGEPPLTAFSNFYPGLECDESAWIPETLEVTGARGHFVTPGIRGPEHYLALARQNADFPDYPNFDFYELNQAASAQGIRVMLTGVGGNHWLEGHILHLADLARSLRWLSLWKQARWDEVRTGLSPLVAIRRFGIRPLVPAPILRALRPLPPRFPWIAPALRARVNLEDRIAAAEATPPFPTLAQQAVYRVATAAPDVHYQELNDRLYAALPIEDRHPLHDRRIAEFALAIPESQRMRQYTRTVARHATRDLLPAGIRTRAIQAEFSILFARTFESLGEPFFHDLQLARLGWADAAEVQRRAQEMFRLLRAGDPASKRHLWPLWMTAGLEMWLASAAATGSRVQR